MSQTLILSILFGYFAVLILISYLTSRNANSDDFFSANKQSPWYLVAFGMLGASLSGVTFISVPGAVVKEGFAYYQVVLGYIIGYWVIGTILMPMYYKLNLVSIYGYLKHRFGNKSHKTGALFFILSRTLGSAIRLYLAATVLQLFLFDAWNVPFYITVAITILLIWVYTFKGGIKTIVWTDTFQTFFLVSAVIISVIIISQKLDLNLLALIDRVSSSDYSKMFYFDDFKSGLFFPKQFFGGALIAIAMTGLDQDLMQKNLTCKTIEDAQKNMLWFTIVMVFVNLLFLTLGALLFIYSSDLNIIVPERTDIVFPTLALNNFGMIAGIFFLLGITASSYASADSALAALTTSFCIDFLNFDTKDEQTKQREKFWVHIGFSILFLIIILIFQELNNKSVIGAVLKIAGYTYGPLVGLFAIGLFTQKQPKDQLVPYICVLAPILSYGIEILFLEVWGFAFGYSMIIITGLVSFGLLYIIDNKSLTSKSNK